MDSYLNFVAKLKIKQEYRDIINKLKNMGILRTTKVVSDYGEYIAAEKLNLKRATSSSNKGYDATDEQGRLAGKNMTGKSKPFEELPYFFSFMFDIRIEAYGDLSKYDTVIMRGNPTGNGNFTKFYLDNGIVNAVVMVTRKENVEVIKQLIRSRKK